MKILLVSQWYPPEPVQYLSELTETLAELGNRVSVLTAFPNWPYGKISEGYSQRLFFQEDINGVAVHRAPLFPDHSNSGITRAINAASFALSAALVGATRIEPHDAILLLSPPISVFVPAYVLAKKWRAPMVLNIQDMWPEALEAAGLVRSQAALAAVSGFCDFVYRRTSKIIVISEGFKGNLISKGVPPAKIEVISNWVDTEAYSPRPADPDLARRLGMEGKFNFVYAGSMGPSQDLVHVVEAASIVKDRKDIQVVLVGDGNETRDLKERCKSLCLRNVLFPGRFPENEIGQILALADVLLVHLKDSPILRITVPHKTHVYLSMGKPILAAIAGETATLIERARAGVTCSPGDPPEIAAALRKMADMTAEELGDYGRNGRALACERLTKRHLVRQYLEVLQQA